MTPDEESVERAYRALLLETMKPCRELPRNEREAKRVEDRRRQRQMDEWAGSDSPKLRAV